MTILVSTQDQLGDYKIVKTFGLVRGNTVRSRNIARNILGNFRTMFGGEIPEYTKLLAESREQSLDRMIAEAEMLGANAILSVRFITSEVGTVCSEMLAYGTAVRVESNGSTSTSNPSTVETGKTKEKKIIEADTDGGLIE
ncbi:MAG TPA: YbjQ family protein [Gammaproteobacteria bacterium]|nr:YbjQ family protein [Gammaproteobacteria bacterium]